MQCCTASLCCLAGTKYYTNTGLRIRTWRIVDSACPNFCYVTVMHCKMLNCAHCRDLLRRTSESRAQPCWGGLELSVVSTSAAKINNKGRKLPCTHNLFVCQHFSQYTVISFQIVLSAMKCRKGELAGRLGRWRETECDIKVLWILVAVNATVVTLSVVH